MLYVAELRGHEATMEQPTARTWITCIAGSDVLLVPFSSW